MNIKTNRNEGQCSQPVWTLAMSSSHRLVRSTASFTWKTKHKTSASTDISNDTSGVLVRGAHLLLVVLLQGLTLELLPAQLGLKSRNLGLEP